MVALAVGFLLAGVACAQDSTNAASGTNFSSFQIIAQRNIFDPTRSGRVSRFTRPRAAVAVYFSFSGVGEAALDKQHNAAMFNGYGCPYRQLYVGNVINGFKIVQISPPTGTNASSVQLALSNSPPITLYQGMQMRREEDGPWKVSDQPEPAAELASTSDMAAKPGGADADSSSPSSANSSSSPGASATESDIVKRLRQQREAEDK